jgi:hypothetical protein
MAAKRAKKAGQAVWLPPWPVVADTAVEHLNVLTSLEKKTERKQAFRKLPIVLVSSVLSNLTQHEWAVVAQVSQSLHETPILTSTLTLTYRSAPMGRDWLGLYGFLRRAATRHSTLILNEWWHLLVDLEQKQPERVKDIVDLLSRQGKLTRIEVRTKVPTECPLRRALALS